MFNRIRNAQHRAQRLINSAARFSSSPTGSASATAAPKAVPTEPSRGLGIFVFGALVATTVGLGTWQSVRYFWKVDVIEKRKKDLEMPPIDLTTEHVDNINSAEMGVRRVSLEGVFDYSKEVRIKPRPPPKGIPPKCIPRTGNSGYLLIAPLVRPDGQRILVLRGWWGVDPQNPRKASWWHPATPEDIRSTVRVEGVLKEGENPGAFAVAHPDEARGEFAWMDLPAIAKYCGATEGANGPILVEAIRPPPERAGEYPFTKIAANLAETYVMPMTHIVYAGTWYTLAAAGTALTYLRFRKNGSAASATVKRARSAATEAMKKE